MSKTFSDAKELEPKRHQRSQGDGGGDEKLLKGFQTLAEDSAAFAASFQRHGVPVAAQGRLLPLLQRWGTARVAQVLGLWTFLGDGRSRLPATAALQVWGPAGTGKTEALFSFLQALGIRHVRLNCACFALLGELQARLVEELRRCALSAGTTAAAAPARSDTPKGLQHKPPMGCTIRPLDRLEAGLKAPLQHLARGDSAGKPGGVVPDTGKVVVVLEHSQELPRYGDGTIDSLLTLPEVLQRGGQLCLVFVGRLPFSALGVRAAQEPPAVAFPAYSAEEVEALLVRALSAKSMPAHTNKLEAAARGPSKVDICALCSNGLMKFAVPYVGHNLHDLFRIGEEVLFTHGAAGVANASMASLQQTIDRIVQERLGLCDVSGLLEAGEDVENAAAAGKATMRRMTEAEIRLLVSAYVAARVDKEDDIQLFAPAGRRRRRKNGSVVKQHSEDNGRPAFLRTPQPAPLSRLLAIYHRLAQQPQLLGPPLLEQFMKLRELGLLCFAGNRVPALDRDPIVVCRAELPLIRACAAELNIDLAEYLCNS